MTHDPFWEDEEPFWEDEREASVSDAVVGCALAVIFACSTAIVAFIGVWVWGLIT